VNSRHAFVLALAISLVYVLALAYPVQQHVVGVFSDFYVRFAPDADRLAAGLFPENTYNPPGYPALLVAGSWLTGDHFTSGKWMSLFAAGLAGVLTFLLARRLFGPSAGVLAMPIVLFSEAFTTYAVTAMTDVPFVCVLLGAMLVITWDDAEGEGRRFVWAVTAGALCGAAYLMRYNALFLLVPGVVAAATRGRPGRARVLVVATFLGSALVTALPWLLANHAHHGSPFYSTNYEDVARAFGISRAHPFTSLADVVLHDPARVIGGYAKNVPFTTYQTFGASLALLPAGPLAALGIALALARRRTRPVLLVLLAALSFIALMGLTHWEKRYFFFMLACWSGFAAFAMLEIGRWIAGALRSPMAGRVAVGGLALWILVPSSVLVWRSVAKTLSRQPVELLPAARLLASDTPPGATVMSVRAQIAYLSRRQWRPLPGADSIEDLGATLRRERPPDYLVYDRWARRFIPQLKTLADPAGSPPWLEAVYSDPSIVVYRVEMDRAR